MDLQYHQLQAEIARASARRLSDQADILRQQAAMLTSLAEAHEKLAKRLADLALLDPKQPIQNLPLVWYNDPPDPFSRWAKPEGLCLKTLSFMHPRSP